MDIAVRNAISTARARDSDGGRAVTTNEAREILALARAPNMHTSERELQRALGRAYEAPLATITNATQRLETLSLRAEGRGDIRMSAVFTGVPGEVSLSFSRFHGDGATLREQAFRRLVEHVYGLSTGAAAGAIASHPALAALREQFMAAGERYDREVGERVLGPTDPRPDGAMLHFPPSLSTPPTATAATEAGSVPSTR